jgi:ribosomal protein L32
MNRVFLSSAIYCGGLKTLSSIWIKTSQFISHCYYMPSSTPALIDAIPSSSIPNTESNSLSSIFINAFLWMAAPKKKTSHARKRLRQLNKQLKNLTSIYPCPLCGHAKRTHRLCLNCLKQRLLQFRSAKSTSPGS